MARKRLKYVVYDPDLHSVAGKCHRELQAHRWMENEKTRKGYAKRKNKELAEALVKWMTRDPRWKGATPVKSASAWVKQSTDFHEKYFCKFTGRSENLEETSFYFRKIQHCKERAGNTRTKYFL